MFITSLDFYFVYANIEVHYQITGSLDQVAIH